MTVYCSTWSLQWKRYAAMGGGMGKVASRRVGGAELLARNTHFRCILLVNF